MRTLRLLFLCLLSPLLSTAFAQAPTITNIEPPNWWTGMTLNRIQIMLYGKNLENATTVSHSSNVKVIRTQSTSPSHAFVDVDVSPRARPGNYEFSVTSRNGTTSFTLPLLKRRHSPNEHNGFNTSDVIYLIMPDRFANGDTANDNVAGMIDSVQRDQPYGRHGGDLQGVINKLDYLQDLGVTALWLTPCVENNTGGASYHGYATTDMYRIDPRLGTNALYGTLVKEAHRRGLKIIMDHVNNHISINHQWINDLPRPDWLNGTVGNHQKSFHSKLELNDPHSDSTTKRKATLGWFAPYMPDLNQTNPSVASYLIQNTIWWIESSGIDGIREDTYPYIDPEFRERWCKTIMKEYPRFNIVGEVWIQDPVYLAPYQRKSYFPKQFEPQLPAVTDFGLFDALMKAFADSSGKIENVFNCLTKDFLFPDPDNLVTFLDNHDIRRIMFNVQEDEHRFKLALITLLTTRGIPQILYGTEIGMKGGPDHGTLRADFPGGFPGDVRTAFAAEGRTDGERNIFNYTKHLLHIRKSTTALQTGRLIHFKPVNDVYVYFRVSAQERILVIINHNKEKQMISLEPFGHLLENVVRLRELLTGREFDLSQVREIDLEGMTGGIFSIVSESQ